MLQIWIPKQCLLERRPIIDFFKWIDKPYEDGELETHGSKLFQLICGKAYYFLHKFEGLLNNCNEVWQTIGLLSLSDGEHRLLRDLAASLATQAMSEFRHRVVDVVTSEPWSALLMVKERHCDVACHERQRIARSILNTPDQQLCVNLQNGSVDTAVLCSKHLILVQWIFIHHW